MKTRFIIILLHILFLCISCNPGRNNPARTDLANLFPEKTESKCHILCLVSIFLPQHQTRERNTP